jgi:hypothetical protein
VCRRVQQYRAAFSYLQTKLNDKSTTLRNVEGWLLSCKNVEELTGLLRYKTKQSSLSRLLTRNLPSGAAHDLVFCLSVCPETMNRKVPMGEQGRCTLFVYFWVVKVW